MMRSLHIERFNHDPDAAEYDQDVLNTADPVRAGYADTLQWVVATARVGTQDSVLDLGAGTGNLTAMLPRCRQIVALDVSRKMMAIGESKLDQRSDVEWVEDDLLGYLSSPRAPTFDAIVSTYALHHLTEEEKRTFARLAVERLSPGGRCVVGDLMFENARQRAQVLGELKGAGDNALVETIEDEFFWDLAQAEATWQDLGWDFQHRRFSFLSWGFCAVRC